MARSPAPLMMATVTMLEGEPVPNSSNSTKKAASDSVAATNAACNSICHSGAAMRDAPIFSQENHAANTYTCCLEAPIDAGKHK